MDPTSRITAAIAAAPSGATPAVAAGPPDHTQRIARFDALASMVLDASGQISEAQRVAAYQGLQDLRAGGRLIGLEPERQRRLDQATYDSDIGRRARELSTFFGQAVRAAGRAGGAASALSAGVQAFDALSGADQAILFATTINAPDRLGQRPYADVRAWRDNAEAQGRIVDYMKTSGVVGPDDRLDHRAAAAKAQGDSRFSAALKLSQARDNTSPAWTAAVTQLLGAARAPDRLDLSPAAQQRVGDQPVASAPTPTYQTGSIVSRVA